MDDSTQEKKSKGGKPKKNKAKESSNKKKGIPKKQRMDEAISINNEPSSEEYTLDFGFVERSKGKW